MVIIEGYDKYCFDDLVPIYHPDGELRCQAFAMRPDTPPEIVEKMKELNEAWKIENGGLPLYLFPGAEHYPAELLNQ